MTDRLSNEWATPAISSSPPRSYLSHRREASPHSKGRSSFLSGLIEGHEARSPPVAQVLPNTPNKSRTLTTNRPIHELAHEPKNLFQRQDVKYPQRTYEPYSSPTRLKEMNAIDLSFADQTYGILNEEDTLHQSVLLEADTELKRRENIAVGTEELRSGGVGRDSYVELSDRRHRDFERTKPSNIAIATSYSQPLPRPPISVGAEIQAKPSYLTTENHDGAYYTGGLSTGYGAGKSYDLQSWQQHMTHQQTNPHLQAHLEHLHLSSKGLNTALSSLNLGGSNPNLNQDIGSIQEPSRLSAVIRAKDNILQEKNIIIDKQKLELAHYEEQIKELKLQDRHRQYARASEEGDMMLIKIQEYQYEVSSLKAQLAEVSTAKVAEVEILNRTLGEREYEIDQLKKSIKDATANKTKEVEDLRKKLVSRESRTEEIKGKFERLREKYEKAKRKESSYNSYLQELPTMKDHRNNVERLKNLKEKETLLTERINHLESSLAEVRKASRGKDTELSELHMSVESYKEEISKLKIVIGANGGSDVENLKLFKEKDIDELRKENDVLRKDVSRLQQLVDSKHSKLRSMHEQTKDKFRSLEGRVEQEESTVHSLREALQTKDRDLEKMQESMRQLAAQSQEMYEHNLNLTEKCQELEKAVSQDYIEYSQQLLLEISACVTDLQCLVHILVEQAEGKEPNMSMLLGVKSLPSMLDSDGDATSTSKESMKSKLKQVQHLQADIDKLRSMLSDKYAEDLGDQCVTH
ncbi:centrosomal protein of 85 kDa-like isoform X2 [Anneissia japonica]|uniref:centrosomal protein of 85 kDa-like isoform X2 n=1 Tax=Anneissia japonica TaxID=1529436 RepID=UPI0014257B54|nr:centrosomal protein of 85 kDa-like isoform X2 [Anneissia japonica]